MNMHVTTPLKAGDKVKVLHTDYPDYIPVGSVTTVVRVDRDGDADLASLGEPIDDGLFFFASEFEVLPASKFKVGDKIRWLGETTEFFSNDGIYEVARAQAPDNYILTDNRQPDAANANHHTNTEWLAANFEKVAEPKFKVGDKIVVTVAWRPDITAGKTYDIIKVNESDEEALIKDDVHANHWLRFTQIALAPAELKFKVGDRVIVAKDSTNGARSGHKAQIGDQFTLKEWTYGKFWKTVGGPDFYEDELVGQPAAKPWTAVPVDAWHSRVGYPSAPLFTGFDLAKPNQAIVCNVERGQPLPSTRPHVHATTADATKEANRLARMHPGSQFSVYEKVSTISVLAPVYAHEWQRLAKAGQKLYAIKALRDITGLGLLPAKNAVEAWLAAS